MSKELWDKAKQFTDNCAVELGPYFSYQILNNTSHILFTLSRYKFASRMLPLEPGVTVLELGCNEGLGTMLLAEKAGDVLGVDFDDKAIAQASAHMLKQNVRFLHADFMGKSFGSFDVVASLDVVEHIAPEIEDKYFATIVGNLAPHGTAIVGTPNESASPYASEPSRISHINLYSAQRLYASMRRHFHNVFLFGMNDEVLHTGFHPMCHYLFALGCGPIARSDS
jgi:2-polyprenyl-3-methyl-5-hydroxy-6-metoxy-1,4-benzoquinol methylase